MLKSVATRHVACQTCLVLSICKTFQPAQNIKPPLLLTARPILAEFVACHTHISFRLSLEIVASKPWVTKIPHNCLQRFGFPEFTHPTPYQQNPYLDKAPVPAEAVGNANEFGDCAAERGCKPGIKPG